MMHNVVINDYPHSTDNIQPDSDDIHPDLRTNYSSTNSFDFNINNQDEAERPHYPYWLDISYEPQSMDVVSPTHSEHAWFPSHLIIDDQDLFSERSEGDISQQPPLEIAYFDIIEQELQFLLQTHHNINNYNSVNATESVPWPYFDQIQTEINNMDKYN